MKKISEKFEFQGKFLQINESENNYGKIFLKITKNRNDQEQEYLMCYEAETDS